MIRRLLASCLLALTLSHCTPQPSAVKNYSSRIISILNVTSPAPDTASLSYPERRLLRVETVPATISIREFLSMRQCTLHLAIADKNSLLGRLARPSQALFTDLRILHHGPACIEQLQSDGQRALAEKLTRELISKRGHLASLLWQVMLGDEENAGFWSRHEVPDNYPHEVNNEAEAAIERLQVLAQRILDGDYSLTAQEESAFETSLNIVRNADGGILLNQFELLNRELQRANQALQMRVERPLCLNGSPTESARHLQNVVRKFFIAEVQPLAVALQQRYQQLMPTYLQLEATLMAEAAPAYRQWAEQRQQRFEQGLAASRRHVLKLQAIYSQCGLRAG